VGAGAEANSVTPREYELYMDWKDGREDPRLEKYSDAVKLKKIARSLNVEPKELEAIIGRVGPVAGTLKAETEKAVKAALDETPIKARISSVEVNIATGHVVAYVKWKCGDQRDVDEEAAWVAWAVNQGGGVVRTAGVWCVNEIDTKLFSAKIGRASFERIRKEAIERFASSRYIRLFEEVKRGPHR
jgi:hypothetical protein